MRNLAVDCVLLALVAFFLYLALLKPASLTANDHTAYSRAEGMSHLVRGCIKCHGITGPNKVHFDPSGRLHDDMTWPRLRNNVRISLAPGSKYAPDTWEELRDMRKAYSILKRDHQ